MPTFGVVSTGFKQKLVDDVLTEIVSDEKAAFGAGINVLATSVLGQINTIFASKIAELWELGAAVYNSQYPDVATGLSLDNIASITGVARLAATRSTATLSLNLQPGATVPLGSAVSVGLLGARFTTLAAATNATGVAANIAVNARAENYGPISALATTINAIQSPVSGWSAKAALTCANSAPYVITNGQALAIKVDNGAAQTVIFEDPGDITSGAATALQVATTINAETAGLTATVVGTQVRVESDTDGPGSAIEVVSGTALGALGFSTVKVEGMNPADATPGRNLETDAELRIRREDLLRSTGNAAVEAVRSDVLLVPKVTQALVIENVTDTGPDANGLPAHSVEVIADWLTSDPPDLNAIATAVFNSVAAGIYTHATAPNDYRDGGTFDIDLVTDSQGFTHDIRYTRAASLPLFITATVAGTAANFSTNAEAVAAVKTALVAEVATLQIGNTAIFEKLKCACFDVAGITDITSFGMDTNGLPGTGLVNVTPSFREKVTLNSSDIVVTVTGVP